MDRTNDFIDYKIDWNCNYNEFTYIVRFHVLFFDSTNIFI